MRAHAEIQREIGVCRRGWLQVSGHSLSEVLFEMHRVGDYIRVTAIDPQTGREAVTFGPANATPFTLQQMAKRKLEYILGLHGPEENGQPEARHGADSSTNQDGAAPLVVPPLNIPGNRAKGVVDAPPPFKAYGPPRGRK